MHSFLWKLSSHLQKDVPKVKTYPWTGKNDYMILSDTDFIAIGGGYVFVVIFIASAFSNISMHLFITTCCRNGKFGLWLNSNLEKGYSDTCPTFDNESLSPKPEFNCIEMEIWGFSL